MEITSPWRGTQPGKGLLASMISLVLVYVIYFGTFWCVGCCCSRGTTPATTGSIAQKRGGKNVRKIVISDSDPFNLAPEDVSGTTASGGGTAGGSQPGTARQSDAVRGTVVG